MVLNGKEVGVDNMPISTICLCGNDHAVRYTWSQAKQKTTQCQHAHMENILK